LEDEALLKLQAAHSVKRAAIFSSANFARNMLELYESI
jgi:hypothetical protein